MMFDQKVYDVWDNMDNMTPGTLDANPDKLLLNEEVIDCLSRGINPPTIGWAGIEAGYRTILGASFSDTGAQIEVFWSNREYYIRTTICKEGEKTKTNAVRKKGLRDAITSFCDDLWLINPLDHLCSKLPEKVSAAYEARGYGSWQ